ncbi:hypothetical protein MRX96_016126 [Rhipicephalus microplus]
MARRASSRCASEHSGVDLIARSSVFGGRRAAYKGAEANAFTDANTQEERFALFPFPAGPVSKYARSKPCNSPPVFACETEQHHQRPEHVGFSPPSPCSVRETFLFRALFVDNFTAPSSL